MAQEHEEFLKIEESAKRLVEALESLHQETISYQTSTKQLEEVRQNLVRFIETTQEISKNTYESIKTLRAIGGPEIHASLNSLSEKMHNDTLTNDTNMQKMFASLDSLSGKIDQGIKKIGEDMLWHESLLRKTGKQILIILMALFLIFMTIIIRSTH